MTGGKVFISHDSRDMDFVRELEKSLDNLLINCYVSENVRDRGDPKETIPRQIGSSNYVIVYFSKNAKDSNWVNQEIGVAFADHPRDLFIIVDEYGDVNEDGALIQNENSTKLRKNKEGCAIFDLLVQLRGEIESPPLVNKLEIRWECGGCEKDRLRNLPPTPDLEELNPSKDYLVFECDICGHEDKFHPRTFHKIS